MEKFLEAIHRPMADINIILLVLSAVVVPGSAPSDITAQQTNGSSSKEYSRQLTALNCSVRDWITKHVNGNPLCDLNPIFRDYEQHLASIERRYGGEEEEKKKKTSLTAAPAAASSSSSLFSFSKAPADDAAQSPGVTFNFGQKVDGSLLGSLGPKATPPSFSFSSSQTSLFGAPRPTGALDLFTFKGLYTNSDQ